MEDAYSHLSAVTAADGAYRIDFSPASLGQFDGFADILIRKEGFGRVNRSVVIYGEVRLDVELIRQ